MINMVKKAFKMEVDLVQPDHDLQELGVTLMPMIILSPHSPSEILKMCSENSLEEMILSQSFFILIPLILLELPLADAVRDIIGKDPRDTQETSVFQQASLEVISIFIF